MARKNLLRGLPPAGTKRWMARRKAAVVLAVRRDLITQEEACRRYELSEEEFSSWQWSFDNYGIDGLRIKHIQRYDRRHSSPLAKAVPTAASSTPKTSSASLQERSQQSLAPNIPVPERVSAQSSVLIGPASTSART
jgi:Protein of unknown function (DUF1153)